MAGNIREYTNTDNALQPSEAGATTVARAAARAGVMGHQTGAYIRESGQLIAAGAEQLARGGKAVGNAIEDIQSHNEISTFTNALMQTHAQLDKSWAEARAKTDLSQQAGPDWVQKTALPALDKLVDGMATRKGRDHAQQMVDAAKLHYGHTTTADDMSAAGDNVVRNLNVVISGATIRSSRDFSTVDYNSGLIRESAEGAIKSGTFGVQEQLKIRDAAEKAVKENVLAGLKGAAERNPSGFKAQLERGDFDKMGIDAHEKDQLGKYARMTEREHQTDARNAAIDQSIATTKKSEAEFQRILNGVGDPTNSATWSDLAKGALTNSKMTSEDRVRLLNLSTKRLNEIQDAQTGKLQRPNPMADYDLYRRLGDPAHPLTPQDIDDAVHSPDMSKRISVDQGVKLLKELHSSGTADAKPENKEWTEATKGAIDGVHQDLGLSNPTRTPDAGTPYQFQAAQTYIRDLFARARTQGIASRDLTDPDSKNYYLKDPGLQRILKDPKPYALKNVKPGETAPPPAAGSGTQKPAPAKGGKSLSDILDGK